MSLLQQIKDIEAEMARTQKVCNYHDENADFDE